MEVDILRLICIKSLLYTSLKMLKITLIVIKLAIFISWVVNGKLEAIIIGADFNWNLS